MQHHSLFCGSYAVQDKAVIRGQPNERDSTDSITELLYWTLPRCFRLVEDGQKIIDGVCGLQRSVYFTPVSDVQRSQGHGGLIGNRNAGECPSTGRCLNTIERTLGLKWATGNAVILSWIFPTGSLRVRRPCHLHLLISLSLGCCTVKRFYNEFVRIKPVWEIPSMPRLTYGRKTARPVLGYQEA